MYILKIPEKGNTLFLPAEEIIRVEAVSNYSRLYFTSGKKILVSKVLRWCQNLLPEEIFVRVHHGHLVNRNFVKELQGRSSKTILLQNGEIISISKRKKKSVVNILQ